MRDTFKRPNFGETLFVAGVAVCLFGLGLLLVTTGLVDRGFAVWPLAITAFGIIVAQLALARRFRTSIFFMGVFLALGGVELVVMNALHWSILKAWPLFMVAVGLTIVPTGLRRYRRIRAAFIVPAAIFVILGILFSLFSFKLIRVSFRRVIMMWWPLIIVAAGASLFVLYALNRVRFSGRVHPGRRR